MRENNMSYLIKDEHGHTRFTEFVSKKYLHIPVEHRDAILMDMLGEMKFGCGKTRWGSPILFTHIDSRKIIVSIKCPIDANGWFGCPYSTPLPNQTYAHIHDQGYEIRILGDINGSKVELWKDWTPRAPEGSHWLDFQKEIRSCWDCAEVIRKSRTQSSKEHSP